MEVFRKDLRGKETNSIKLTEVNSAGTEEKNWLSQGEWRSPKVTFFRNGNTGRRSWMVLAIPTDKGTWRQQRHSPLGPVISLSVLQILPRSSSPLYDVPSCRQSRARLPKSKSKICYHPLFSVWITSSPTPLPSKTTFGSHLICFLLAWEFHSLQMHICIHHQPNLWTKAQGKMPEHLRVIHRSRVK